MLYSDLLETGSEADAQEAVTNLIQNRTATITFKKADGSERTLIGSISESVIPTEAWSDPSGAREPNNDIQVIYDLEKSGWRSFRWDRLISVTPYVGKIA